MEPERPNLAPKQHQKERGIELETLCYDTTPHGKRPLAGHRKDDADYKTTWNLGFHVYVCIYINSCNNDNNDNNDGSDNNTNINIML